MRGLTGICIALVAGLVAHAKDRPSSDWASVAQIAVGKRIEVRLKDGSKASGTLVRAGQQDVVVRTKDRETVYDKTTVARVRVRKGLSRTAKVLVGTAAGAAIGGGIGAVIGTSYDDGSIAALVAGIGTGAGAGIGAAVGAVVPPGWRTVYQADRP
jgi:hypothetical protein